MNGPSFVIVDPLDYLLFIGPGIRIKCRDVVFNGCVFFAHIQINGTEECIKRAGSDAEVSDRQRGRQ